MAYKKAKLFRVEFIGHLGADPEMRYTASGQPVTSFRVALGTGYKDSNGTEVDRTLWVRVSVWGNQAEPCNTYLKKGSEVFVEGILNGEYLDNGKGQLHCNGPKIWTTQSGETAASWDVKADRVQFLGTAGGGSGSAPAQAANPVAAQDDDIPF